MRPASLKCYSTSSGTFLCTKTGLSYLSVESAEWRWPWLSAGLTPIAGTLLLKWPSGGSFFPRWLTPSGRSRPLRCARSPGEWCRGRCVPSLPASWRTQAPQLEGKWVVMARGSRRLSAPNPCWCLLLTLWSLIPHDFGPLVLCQHSLLDYEACDIQMVARSCLLCTIAQIKMWRSSSNPLISQTSPLTFVSASVWRHSNIE